MYFGGIERRNTANSNKKLKEKDFTNSEGDRAFADFQVSNKKSNYLNETKFLFETQDFAQYPTQEYNQQPNDKYKKKNELLLPKYNHPMHKQHPPISLAIFNSGNTEIAQKYEYQENQINLLPNFTDNNQQDQLKRNKTRNVNHNQDLLDQFIRPKKQKREKRLMENSDLFSRIPNQISSDETEKIQQEYNLIIQFSTKNEQQQDLFQRNCAQKNCFEDKQDQQQNQIPMCQSKYFQVQSQKGNDFTPYS